MTLLDLRPQTTLSFEFKPDLFDRSYDREPSWLFPNGRPVLATFGAVKVGTSLPAEVKTCSLTPRFQYAGGSSFIPERSGLLCVKCSKCGREVKVDTFARADAVCRVTMVCPDQ